MKIQSAIIEWVEHKISEICLESGFGHVVVIWHIKNGKLDGTEKRSIQTEKNQYFNQENKNG